MEAISVELFLESMDTRSILVSSELIYLHRSLKCDLLWTPQGMITDSSMFERWLITTYAAYELLHIVGVTLLDGRSPLNSSAISC